MSRSARILGQALLLPRQQQEWLFEQLRVCLDAPAEAGLRPNAAPALTSAAVRNRVLRMRKAGASEADIEQERARLTGVSRDVSAKPRDVSPSVSRDVSRDSVPASRETSREANETSRETPAPRALPSVNDPVAIGSAAVSSPSLQQQPLDLGEVVSASRETRLAGVSRRVSRDAPSFTTQVFEHWQAAYFEHTGVKAPESSGAVMKGAKIVGDWILVQAAQEQRAPIDVLADWLGRLFRGGNPWHDQIDFALHKVAGECAGVYRGAAGKRRGMLPPAPNESFDDVDDSDEAIDLAMGVG